MHEFSLVESIASALLKKGAEESWGRVKRVSLRVGALRQVFPEILGFAFSVVVRDTPLEGASLEINEVQPEWRCIECGKSWREFPGVCSECGSNRIEAVAGMELEIFSVEVEET